MQHEGPAVTAQHRRAARVNAPLVSDVAAVNDRIRVENTAVHQRNLERIGRDPLIRDLHLRLLRLAELDVLIARAPGMRSPEYDRYFSRHTQLRAQVGGIADMHEAVATLPAPARELLRGAHPREWRRRAGIAACPPASAAEPTGAPEDPDRLTGHIAGMSRSSRHCKARCACCESVGCCTCR